MILNHCLFENSALVKFDRSKGSRLSGQLPFSRIWDALCQDKDFSDLPQQGFYRVIISFPEGLKTKYGNMIPAQPHLQGQAEIITEEHRLIERLFYKLRANAFTKNTLLIIHSLNKRK